MEKIQTSSKGFTLLELLVVVIIIGILATIALPQYRKIIRQTYMTEMKTILMDVVKAQQVFYLTNSRWANSLEELDIDLPVTGTCSCYSSVTKGNAYKIGKEGYCLSLHTITYGNSAHSVGIRFGKHGKYGFSSEDIKYGGLEYLLENWERISGKSANRMYCRAGTVLSNGPRGSDHCKGKLRLNNCLGAWYDME